MTSSSGQPRVWSLWIYDRHCSLLFHSDWSSIHNRSTTSQTPSSTLSLSEQSKLVYGVVFSLRNMTRKLSPLESNPETHSSSSSNTATTKELFHSFNTSTYTLSHLQTATNYTFILLTDPIAPPTRRAPSAATASSTFSGGGGIPATGGMSATGVLSQIARGPWVDFVARNAGCTALERMVSDDDDDDKSENGDETEEQIEKARQDRKKIRQKELDKQRMTGIGKSIDSEAFRGAVEAGESNF